MRIGKVSFGKRRSLNIKLSKFNRFVLFDIFLIVIYLVYLIGIQSPMYMSEAKFILRNRSSSSGVSGLTQILSMAGYSRAYDEGFTIQEYWGSKEAIEKIRVNADIFSHYANPEYDVISRFSFLHGRSNDDFAKYMKNNVKIINDTQTGIVTIQVYAFSAEFAKVVNEEFIRVGEALIRNLNSKANADALQLAQSEVEAAEKRASDARESMKAFRDSQDVLDPTKNSLIISEVILKIENELAAVSSQIEEVSRFGQAQNPRLPTLLSRRDSLVKQLSRERGRLAGEGSQNTRQIKEYEYLLQLQDFAARQLSSAYASLEAARLESMRQSIYIVMVEPSTLPDIADSPTVIKNMFIFGFMLFCINIIGWFAVVNSREHGY